MVIIKVSISFVIKCNSCGKEEEIDNTLSLGKLTISSDNIENLQQIADTISANDVEKGLSRHTFNEIKEGIAEAQEDGWFCPEQQQQIHICPDCLKG